MNKINLLTIVLVLLGNTLVLAEAKQAQNDITITTMNQCSNPTINLFIASDGIRYNISELHVPINTCVNINLVNKDIKDHTFTISSSNTDNIAYFNIFAQPGTIEISNFMTPDKEMNIFYFCAVAGHQDAGMTGTLLAGNPIHESVTNNIYKQTTIPLNTPGFEFLSVIIGFSVLTILIKYNGKNNY